MGPPVCAGYLLSVGGGAFQLAEKLPVWSEGFLFELKTFRLGWCLPSGRDLLLGLWTSRLHWGLLSGQRDLPSGLGPPVWNEAFRLGWGFLSVLEPPI